MSPSGVLVVDKPTGPTSHDVVAAARRLLRTRAVGHAGTLDPLASGVLLLLVGEATKLTPWLTAGAKEYRATIALGRATDTLDAEGETTAEARLAAGQPDAGAVDDALEVERQRRSQVPPAVSAISVGGVRAHRLARRGLAPELPPRDVEVDELVLERAAGDELVVRVRASKGYYVRSLARDLGETLGIPAHF
ncbi:MAG: tRNA pseudouridine(55) synthase TruB, partial [Deltaproteobacteria bacterium]|nr:tRNA pseudouridine(55) synthase TruB [Deltaproteobacteria bacterium]